MDQNTNKEKVLVAPLVLDVREAARDLNLSTRTIHRLLKRGDLKAFRCGRRVGVVVESLHAFVAKGGAR